MDAMYFISPTALGALVSITDRETGNPRLSKVYPTLKEAVTEAANLGIISLADFRKFIALEQPEGWSGSQGFSDPDEQPMRLAGFVDAP